MPYIKPNKRIDLSLAPVPTTPGELNYCITELLISYADEKGSCYQTINDVLGALEGAKLEFYRRWAAPYEDLKCRENGDVY